MNRNAIIAAVLVIILGGIAAYLFFNQRGGSSTASTSTTGTMCANRPEASTGLTDAGVTSLKIEDVKEGSGPQAITSNSVRVNYIGRLVNGTEFDSSCKEGRQPFEFTLGGGQVIQGWDSGIVGMRVGGQRRLIIPADLGYGASGSGGTIPPNAALVFDVELLEIKTP
jgi:FKBP-type peptidyl-prolyl cis-trans isomerase